MKKPTASDLEKKFKRVDEIKNMLGAIEACKQMGVKYSAFYKWKKAQATQ